MNTADIRKHIGQTQDEFAKTSGINVWVIRDWEQGRQKPSAAARAYLNLLRWLFDKHRAVFDKWEGMKK